MNLTEASIITLDTETTGTDTERDRICEVGWSRVRYEPVYNGPDEDDGRGFYCGTGHAQLINPGRPIPAVASAVHHIVDSHVERAPHAEEWAKDFHCDLVVAHNAAFDRAFCVRESIIHEDVPWLCTYRLARHLLPEAPAYGNQVLRYWLGFHNVAGDAHSAGHDAEVTAMILCRMLNDCGKDFTIESVIEMSEAPVFLAGGIPFGKHIGVKWTEAPRSYLQWMATQGRSAWDVDVWYTINEILAGRPR